MLRDRREILFREALAPLRCLIKLQISEAVMCTIGFPKRQILFVDLVDLLLKQFLTLLDRHIRSGLPMEKRLIVGFSIRCFCQVRPIVALSLQLRKLLDQHLHRRVII